VVAGAVGGQGFNERNSLGRLRVPKLTKMEANSQYKSLFNTAKLYGCTQPTPGWPRLQTFCMVTSGLGKSIIYHSLPLK